MIKSNKEEKFEYLLKDSSLFSKINFIVIKNPKEGLILELENIEKANNIIIINGEGLRTKSKDKNLF